MTRASKQKFGNARCGDLALIPQRRPETGLPEKDATPEWMLVKVMAASDGHANTFKLLRGEAFVRNYPTDKGIVFYVLSADKLNKPVDTILAEAPSIYNDLDEAREALKIYRVDLPQEA